MTRPHEDPGLEDLKHRQQLLKAQLFDNTERLLDIVCKDIPTYVEREAKKRWLTHTAFASGMSDEKLRAFRDDIRALGASLSQELRAALSGDEVWLFEGELPDDRKDLQANTRVWEQLQAAPLQMARVFARIGLPADAEGTPDTPYVLRYQPPRYFVEGHYCPSLIETYWNHTETWQELSRALVKAQAQTSRQVLERRWEEA